jgi:hypothetical protein
MNVKKLETKDAPVTWKQLRLIASILFIAFMYVAVSGFILSQDLSNVESYIFGALFMAILIGYVCYKIFFGDKDEDE